MRPNDTADAVIAIGDSWGTLSEIPPPTPLPSAHADKPLATLAQASLSQSTCLYGDANGTDGGHRHDSGVPNKTTFPESWDDDKIIDEVEDVAKNPDNPPVYNEDTERWEVEGTRDGVDIFVVVEPDGTIVTGHPTGGEGVHRNDEDGNPRPLD